jgi:hypothetical protein
MKGLAMEAAPLSSRAQELLCQSIGLCDDAYPEDSKLNEAELGQLQSLPKEFFWLKSATSVQGGLHANAHTVPIINFLSVISRHVVSESRSHYAVAGETSPLVRSAHMHASNTASIVRLMYMDARQSLIESGVI